MSSKMIKGPKRFHKYHGSNVILVQEDTVASRKQSYANALVFSDTPLEPNELFLLEIDNTERGWSGDMRMGLTKMNPNTVQGARQPLPQFALPDLSAMRPSWVFAISKSSIFNRKRRPYYSQDLFLSTGHGSVPLRAVLPPTNSIGDRCATDVGSQIGILYVPVTPFAANLHFIVNGIDQGVFASDIPYSDPLYVVVDVYGCTKQVRIIQLKLSVRSLQEMCREAILQHITRKSVYKLPLPNALKDYLLKCHRDET